MRHYWTKKEVDILRETYADTRTKEIADRLHISTTQVLNKANMLGLKKSEEYMRKYVYTVTPNIATQFRKGVPAWNRGMKGIQIGGKDTQFKKGQVPHNLKPDGSERLDRDGYIMIKVNGKYIPKHRYIYEQHYGKIPKGKLIRFKDGKKDNFDIDNLELITREEHQIRNSVHNLPEEIQEVIKLKRTITKLITEHGKRQNSRPSTPSI